MKYVFTMLVLVFGFCQSVNANLLVSPTRIAFEDRDRVKDIILINVTEQTRSYRIEWQENTTDDFGNYILLADNDVSFASSDYIRYSPRQVTLKPGERQVIKLMLRRKSDMDLPEYRSHLKVTALPTVPSTNAESTDEGIDFKINVLTSYTVPVIVRNQKNNANLSLNDIKVNVKNEEKVFFEIDLGKTGTTSINGDINVSAIDPQTGQSETIGILRGINVFHEKDRRVIKVEWQGFTVPRNIRVRIDFIGANEQIGQNFLSVTKDISINDYVRT